MVLFLLHQIVCMFAKSTLVRISRFEEGQDNFKLPGSFESCSRHNECNRFNANLSPTASKRGHCSCSCSRQKAATFGVKNGYWQCINNKEIRQRELSGKLVKHVSIYLPSKSLMQIVINNEKNPLCSSLSD